MTDRNQPINDFVGEFRKSQAYSIDAFLARRSEYADIGKKCIALLLLLKEDLEALLDAERGHWYQFLLNKIAADKWDDLDFSRLSIITFNYDRSLEHYLLVALQANYKKQQEEVIEKLKTLKIVHVYGTLGSVWPNETFYFPYDGTVSPKKVLAAANRIKVIPEGRQDDETLCEARELLLKADSIGFLGFGFDATNLERLDSEKTCATNIIRNEGRLWRRTVASCMGMTVAESIRAATKISHLSTIVTSSFPDGFFPNDCLDTLRESLLI